MIRRLLALLLLAAGLAACAEESTGPPPRRYPPIPEKTVVLTFDDACRTHLTFVAPLLLEHGFGATFFVTARWMNDEEHYLRWNEVATLHEMGFEVGNHTWSHRDYSEPDAAPELPTSLKRVEDALGSAGVPRPTSFAWPKNCFGPEALVALRGAGYRFARRGMLPESWVTRNGHGPLYDPTRSDSCLVPTSANATAWWTQGFFENTVARATAGRAAVIQFHGVPDPANAYLSTPPEAFRAYMDHLEREGFHVIAMRDLARYVDLEAPVGDPLIRARWPE